MLDGVDTDGAFSKSGSALDGLDLGDAGIDKGFIGEVDTTKFKTVAFGGRLECECDFFSCVEGGSFESGFARQCVLHVRHGGFLI